MRRGLITNAGSPAYYGGTALAGAMPPVEAPPEDIERLTHYVFSLGGHASATSRDAELFDENGCQTCHARAGEDPRRGPSLDGFGSRAWIRGVILNAAAPRYFGADSRMPSFQGKLNDSEVDDLLTFLLSEQSAETTPRR